MKKETKNTVVKKVNKMGEQEMREYLKSKSLKTQDGVRIEYEWITPAMVRELYRKGFLSENTGGPDCHEISESEKIITMGYAVDENTPFVISKSAKNANYLKDGLSILAAINKGNIPAVVAIAYDVPEDCTVIVDDHNNKRIYRVINNEVRRIRNEMQKILSEIYEDEMLNSKDGSEGELARIYSHFNAPWRFILQRDYAEKVYQQKDKINENTFGVEIEWFGVFWMLSELTGIESSFFKTIALDSERMNAEAQKYIELCRHHARNIDNLSKDTEVNIRAKRKMQLKKVFQDSFWAKHMDDISERKAKK